MPSTRERHTFPKRERDKKGFLAGVLSVEFVDGGEGDRLRLFCGLPMVEGQGGDARGSLAEWYVRGVASPPLIVAET
ncbi:hypothetical protein V494_02942 [Pseudogymnoascus sp. VKM F-4513 (FW-928)]|nr:hypothetical protein V494_02942 [Pseudogymnoascus sp. VKM F-4513 (FW-928)]